MPEQEPPTEPIDSAVKREALPPRPPQDAFAHDRFFFTAGLRAGQPATIRDAANTPILGYRAFASIVGIVAALVSGIIFVAGVAATLFLIAEGAPFRAGAALILTLLFTIGVALLVPRVHVTIYDGVNPALTIDQRSRSFTIRTASGQELAVVRKGLFSRFGCHRWSIFIEGRVAGYAVEESFARAIRAKLLGKFNRNHAANFRLGFDGEAGLLHRRPDARGHVDLLELRGDTLDRRIAVAVATLIVGLEP